MKPEARGKKVGEALMRNLAAVAVDMSCIAIKWTVAPWNADGIRFYERLGARANADWLNYGLDEAALHELTRAT